MWVIKGAMVVDAAFFCFFVLCVLKNEVDWMKLGTNIWTARQLAILQVKFAVIVCYLSTHFSVILLVLLILCCNAVVYVVWFRLMKTSRKGKQKYSNPNYQDENENEEHKHKLKQDIPGKIKYVSNVIDMFQMLLILIIMLNLQQKL